MENLTVESVGITASRGSSALIPLVRRRKSMTAGEFPMKASVAPRRRRFTT